MEGKKMSLRTKTIVSVVSFAVVFAALVVAATFCDLEISKILTKHSLTQPAFGQTHGGYISNSGFALFFEALGSCPFYLMVSVVGAIFFWFGARKGGKWYWLAAAGAVVSVVGFTLLVKDLFAYTAEYIGYQLESANSSLVLQAKEIAGSPYMLALSVVLGAAATVGLIMGWKRIPAAVNNKMIWWAIAILGTLACYLVVHFVKSPVGRVRFRAMNYINDTQFSYFTRWYVVNGKRVLTADGIVASTPQAKEAIIVASDACKSFPSGHTFSAGMVYSLLALPYLSEKCNKKGVKIGLWIGTVAYTGLVAVSRIVAGAHYMSDVLFGGTIVFAAAIIMREIFVCKGCHWFALFPRKKALAQEAVGQQAGDEAAPMRETAQEAAEQSTEDVQPEQTEQPAETTVEESVPPTAQDE